MKKIVKESESLFRAAFRTLTGSPWNDEPAGRVISYEFMMFRTEAQTQNLTEFLMRGLWLAESEPSAAAQHAILSLVTNTFPRLKGKFGAEGPEPVYQEILELMRNPGMRDCVMRLAELGAVIVYRRPDSGRSFLNEMYKIIPPQINPRTFGSFAVIMGKLSYLSDTRPDFADAPYVAFCCELMKTPQIAEPEKVTQYTPKHVQSRIARQKEEANAATYAQERGYAGIHSILEKMFPQNFLAADIDTLFSHAIKDNLRALSQSAGKVRKFAEELVFKIDFVRKNSEPFGANPENVPAFLLRDPTNAYIMGRPKLSASARGIGL